MSVFSLSGRNHTTVESTCLPSAANASSAVIIPEDETLSLAAIPDGYNAESKNVNEIFPEKFPDDLCLLCGLRLLGQGSLKLENDPVRDGSPVSLIEGYGQDAVAALGERQDAFTAEDQAWIAQNYASTLHEVEKATMRLVALRAAGSISGAAELLGMAPVSLRRWISRRSPVLRQAPAFWGKWRF